MEGLLIRERYDTIVHVASFKIIEFISQIEKIGIIQT